MTIENIKKNPDFYLHHIATRVGYVSRKSDGEIKEYDGRFGKGYIHIRPRFDSTRYVYYDYYIKKEVQKLC